MKIWNFCFYAGLALFAATVMYSNAWVDRHQKVPTRFTIPPVDPASASSAAAVSDGAPPLHLDGPTNGYASIDSNFIGAAVGDPKGGVLGARTININGYQKLYVNGAEAMTEADWRKRFPCTQERTQP
jgi:hypothetical protein